MIGHSQLKKLETYTFESKPEINFQIDFRAVNGGKAPELAKNCQGIDSAL